MALNKKSRLFSVWMWSWRCVTMSFVFLPFGLFVSTFVKQYDTVWCVQLQNINREMDKSFVIWMHCDPLSLRYYLLSLLPWQGVFTDMLLCLKEGLYQWKGSLLCWSSVIEIMVIKTLLEWYYIEYLLVIIHTIPDHQ